MADDALQEEVKDAIKECLDDIDLEKVDYNDFDEDADTIEIVIRGKFKQDAFTNTSNKPKTKKDPFDDAKPF